MRCSVDTLFRTAHRRRRWNYRRRSCRNYALQRRGRGVMMVMLGLFLSSRESCRWRWHRVIVGGRFWTHQHEGREWVGSRRGLSNPPALGRHTGPCHWRKSSQFEHIRGRELFFLIVIVMLFSFSVSFWIFMFFRVEPKESKGRPRRGKKIDNNFARIIVWKIGTIQYVPYSWIYCSLCSLGGSKLWDEKRPRYLAM